MDLDQAIRTMRNCPFCASRSLGISTISDTRWEYEGGCSECGATMFADTLEELIAKWNRREMNGGDRETA